jgi:cell wall-associated NlpC family hydrolase
LRTARTLLQALLFGVIAVGIVAPTTIAHADPSKAELQQQIDKASSDLEKIAEQYNKVTGDLQASQATAAKLQAQIRPLQQSLDAAYATISGIAVAAYKGGSLGTAGALLQSGSPQNLLDQLNTLDQLGRKRSTEIAGFKQAKAQYDAQKQQLNTLMATQTSTQNGLAAQKAKYNGDLQKLYAMRTKLFGSPTQVDTGNHPAPPYVAGKAGAAVRYAYAKLGKPYVFAAAGPNSFDCSGLTMAAWSAAGVGLPHNAAEQWSTVSHISRSQLQPGDLVFYNGLGHVAIYVGGNQVIHAPHEGTVVQLASISVDSLYGYGRP